MYKLVNTIFLIIFMILLILVVWFDYPWQIILPFIGGLLIITFLGSYFIQLNYFIHSLNQKSTSDKVVALTFDDGPSPKTTEKVLALLAQFDMKASFFLIGKHVKEHPEIVKKIMDGGHSIGHHSYHHHFWFDFYGKKKVMTELKDSMIEIEHIIDKTPLLFRPPYGVTNPSIATAIQQLGLHSVGWNIRTLDTVKKDRDSVLNIVKKKLKPGSVILLHDSLPNSPEILEGILRFLNEQGYRSVTVDELFNIEAYA